MHKMAIIMEFKYAPESYKQSMDSVRSWDYLSEHSLKHLLTEYFRGYLYMKTLYEDDLLALFVFLGFMGFFLDKWFLKMGNGLFFHCSLVSVAK